MEKNQDLRRMAEEKTRSLHVPGNLHAPEKTLDLLHELQVHQIELEMQNAQLLEARQEAEAALEQYTDLYDFAPVGDFSVDETGLVLKVNLTGLVRPQTGRSDTAR